MPKFFLILTGEGEYPTMSPAENEAALKAYMEWTGQLRANGTFLDAERLSADIKIINPGPSPVITDGPFAESKEAIGGFFVVNAANIEEAASIGSGCPHLKYGGVVQVRGVYEFN